MKEEKSEKKTTGPQALGKTGERAAVAFLKKKGFRILEQGFRFCRGEIDIIAYDKGTLVFLEVKTRKSSAFGYPEEYVTPAKQRQLRKVAGGYLVKNRLGRVPCRFDVISVTFDEAGNPQVRHLDNAF